MEIIRFITANDKRLKSKFLIITFLVTILSISLFCFTAKADYASVSSGTTNLSSEFGKSWAKDDIPYSFVTINSANATYVAGSTASFGAGGTDVWLIKVSQRLNVFPGLGSYYQDSVDWRKTYGGSQDDIAKSVIQSSDGNLVLAGQTKSYGSGGFDVFLLKVDADGNLLWNRTYGGALDDGANCVVQSSDGGYVLAGYTSSNAGSLNAWLVKTDSLGNLLWSNVYPGLAFNSVSRTSDEGYVLAAKCANAFELIKVDSSGQLLWNQTYGVSNFAEAECAIQTAEGGYAVAGYTNDSTGAFSARLLKTDQLGNVQWGKTYPGLGAYYVIQTTEGGYALTGDRAFLMITDSSGNILWNRNYDGLSDDNLQFTRAYDLLEPAPNQFVMTGTQQSYGQMLTGLDGFITRVSLRNGDTTPPKITVLSPENKIYTTSNLSLICTVDKSTLWMAYQIDNGRNVTMSGNTTLTLPDGQHNMTIYAADANYNNGASNIVFFSNFEVDTVPINVAVTSIQNTTYDSKDLPLSFTVGKAVSWTAYSLDGQANFTSPQNTTLTGLSYGTHTLTVYAQDSIGLIEASDTIKFAILDQSLPEFPNILVVAFALSIISITTLVLLKIKSKQSYLTTKNELG
jgi:predicted secreted protein